MKLSERPTIDEWRVLKQFSPNSAADWSNELLWCHDCQEWHTPASRRMVDN